MEELLRIYNNLSSLTWPHCNPAAFSQRFEVWMDALDLSEVLVD